MKIPKTWLFGVVAVLLIGLGYLLVSPYLFLNNLRSAIQDKDVSALNRYVDFPRVREGLRSQINLMLMEEAKKDTSGFGALGIALAGSLIEPLLNAYISPEGLASVGTGNEPAQGDVNSVQDWAIQHRGFSTVLIHPKDSPKDGLVMERVGLGWKVVRFELGSLAKQ